MRNIHLSRATASDIESQVRKVLRGLDNPEPPLNLDDVRELLRLDRGYYSSSNDSFLREAVSRLAVAGAQIIERPTILLEAVRRFDLRALYLPDRRRILLDEAQPTPKQRWNEAHEIGHSILPWHSDLMLGDNQQSLAPSCHAQIEAEANYTAGQMLFLQERFLSAANDSIPNLTAVRALKGGFGNTYTTTFWRYVEGAHSSVPMLGLIGPHPKRPPANFNPVEPLRYVIESPAYTAMFPPLTPVQLHRQLLSYCGAQRAGPLGEAEIVLVDRNGGPHVFHFETFYNTYDCLTLAVYRRPHLNVVGF